MFDWLASLTDTTGFVPRGECGSWTPEWVALHTGSDILIWLAYLSIPLVLLLAVRRASVRPFGPLVWLFAAFILACGTTHLLEAVIFTRPVYRLSGVVKAATAVVSWATVFALIPAVPMLLAAGGPAAAAGADEAEPPRGRVYGLAVFTAVLAILLRYAIDPLVDQLHPYTLCLLSVTVVSWYGGFWPGLTALLLCGLLATYLFVEPRYSLTAGDLTRSVGLGLFFVSGVGVSVLGEAQRTARRRMRANYAELSAATAALTGEKRTADAALAALDSFVRNAPTGIAYFDADLRFLRVNETFARANGRPVEEHLGRPLADVLPDFPPDLLADYRTVLATGAPLHGRVVRGPSVTWEVTAFPVPLGDAGRGLGVIGVDVTDRHRNEDRLRESEERFRAMANGLPQLAWMTRPDGHIFWYNRRWYEYTGTTLAEMEGWGWQSVHDPAELPRVAAKFKAHLASGEPWEDTFPLRRVDGEFRWHLSRAVPLKDADGRVLLWFGTNTDVTDQRERESALRRSDARFRELADAMPQIVYATDPVGRVEFVNRRWVEYTGQADAQSADLVALVPPDDLEPMLAEWRRCVAAGAPFHAEFRLRGPAGEARWFLTRAVPVRGDDGRVARWYGTSTDIHELKRQEAELVESRRFVEAVLHSLSSHLAVIDESGRIVTVNDAWRQFGEANGIPPGYDWTAANYLEASGRSESGERAVAGIRAVIGGDRDAFEMEYPCHGSGGERYFVLRANRFRGDGPVRLVVTHENVTPRVVAERRVRAAADQLRQLTEGMPLLMWSCRPTGECDYLSRQWVEYTGRPMDEQLGDRWLDTVHPDDRSRTAAAWAAAVEGVAGYDVEYRLRRADGEYRWFAVRGIPLRDPAGRVARWYGCCTDVDDRKRQAATLEQMVTERTAALHKANADLREQRIFLDAILDNVAEGIVACDGDGRLKLFNAATRRMHGVAAEPLPGDRWAERYNLFEADGVTPLAADRVPLARAWAGEVVRDAEMMIRAAGQPDRYVLCTGVRLTAADGTPFGAVVSMRDMTERREYERQLVVTSAALKVSNEELEKFAYIASHDLQEPLRKIQAFGTRLADKSRDALGEQGKDYIDRMLDSAGRMRKLIEDLLAFSRVASKPVPLQPVDLTAVVRDVLEDLSERLRLSHGRVDVGPLPAVPGDPSQLRQVFQNLIGNALKFARPGTPPVVRVTATPLPLVAADADPPPPPGPGWRIVVADNGIGFEQGYADRIFELFQRLHTRSQYEGTGLGLAIVRKIILRHGAVIAARGKPGEGAAFAIDWPTRMVPPP